LRPINAPQLGGLGRFVFVSGKKSLKAALCVLEQREATRWAHNDQLCPCKQGSGAPRAEEVRTGSDPGIKRRRPAWGGEQRDSLLSTAAMGEFSSSSRLLLCTVCSSGGCKQKTKLSDSSGGPRAREVMRASSARPASPWPPSRSIPVLCWAASRIPVNCMLCTWSTGFYAPNSAAVL